MDNFEKRIKKYIVEHSMLTDGQGVIVALSGGSDSVALLLVLDRLGYKCYAAHCNFHLRGEESMRDERFVTDLCDRFSIKLYKTDFDTMRYAKDNSVSVEMAARELRYSYFRLLEKDTGAKCVAVGHHRDDNVETLFLNLLRGTGIRGVCGIQPVNGDVVRPLLCVSRDDIKDYLESLGVGYVTDSTNLVDVYKRNKIRLNVIPELLTVNSAAVDNILTTIENLNEVRKIYFKSIADDMAKCVSEGTDGVCSIDSEKLLSCVSPKSVLHEILTPYGFNADQEVQVMSCLSNGKVGSLFYSPTHVLAVDRVSVVVGERVEQIVPPVPLSGFPDITSMDVPVSSLRMVKDKTHAYVDRDKLAGELFVRSCKPGDSFCPFGMKGKKLVSDYMTDRKFDRIRKMRQLVVCDESDNIVWLVGERGVDTYKVDERTVNVLVLSVSK